MEGLINEQQRKENEEQYKQNPNGGPSSKVKKKHKRQPRATADILRQMVLRERERVMYRRMSAALKPQRLSTSMVIAPNENEEWTERTTKRAMEKAIMEHHVRKYSLTHTTPPMRMPIKRELGFDSLTPAGKRILDGTHTPAPGTDRYSRLLQTQLRRIAIKEIPTGMSTKAYVDGWKKAKEQTSAEPSNISFGQCKALAQDTYLATMEASLLSIAMKSGISFATWKRGVDAVIPKKTSSPRVDKLRTIVLHAADANFCYKHIAKKIVDVAEKIPGVRCSTSESPLTYGDKNEHQASSPLMTYTPTMTEFVTPLQHSQHGAWDSKNLKSNS
jgi:hypothetical protein